MSSRTVAPFKPITQRATPPTPAAIPQPTAQEAPQKAASSAKTLADDVWFQPNQTPPYLDYSAY